MTTDLYSSSKRPHSQSLSQHQQEDRPKRRELTNVDLNAINHTTGYVIHRLLQKYTKVNKCGIVDCLMEMVERRQLDIPSEDERYATMISAYQSKADRGGLVAISANVIKFFCPIEYYASDFGEQLVSLDGMQKSDQSKAVMEVMNDVDILFNWACFTSQLNAEDPRLLLEDVVNTWYHLHLHSIAAIKMEEYKQAQAKEV